MKKILLMSFCLTVLINYSGFTQIETKNLDIVFTGYSVKSENRIFVFLKFELTNNSLDTMYISKRKISIHVFKNKKEVYPNKPSMGLPYIRSSKIKFIKCEEKVEIEKQNEIFINRFSQKIINEKLKNFDVENNSVIENTLRNNCLVIFPKQSIGYETIFTSEKFDSSCEVSAVYDNKKPFGIYSSGNKIMEIYD